MVINNFSSGGAEWDSTPRVQTQAEPQATTVQRMQQPATKTTEKNVDKEKWTGNDQQPLPLSYNHFTESLRKVVVDGAVIHEIKKLSKVLDMADIDDQTWNYLHNEPDAKHRSRYVIDKRKAIDRTNNLNSPNAYLNNVVVASTILSDNSSEYVSGHILDTSISVDCFHDFSIVEAIKTIYSHVDVSGIGRNNTFVSMGAYNSRFPITESELKYITELRECETFADVNLWLKKIYTKIGATSLLWSYVENKLTEIINDALHYRIGLSGSITSAMESTETLIADVTKYESAKASQALMKLEKELVSLVTNVKYEKSEIPDAIVETIYAAYADEPSGVILAHFGFIELGISIDPSCGMGVLNNIKHKELFVLLSKMFENSLIEKDDFVINAQYVTMVFSDTKQIRFYRSALYKDSIIMVDKQS